MTPFMQPDQIVDQLQNCRPHKKSIREPHREPIDAARISMKPHPLSTQKSEVLRRFGDLTRSIPRDTRVAIEAMFNQLFVLGGVLLALCVGIAVFASWSISSGIAKGIDMASTAAQRIGEGDLSQVVPQGGKDEIDH